jgi:hypothetical protein
VKGNAAALAAFLIFRSRRRRRGYRISSSSMKLPLALFGAVTFASAQTVAPVTTSSLPDDLKPPVQLSPFEVVEDTKGYFAGNTMSGTRINSKLEDLGAAITIMTKEQMADFAMLDLNDVFLYSTSTEGTGDYTDFAVNNNGHVADNVQTGEQQRARGRQRAKQPAGRESDSRHRLREHFDGQHGALRPDASGPVEHRRHRD